MHLTGSTCLLNTSVLPAYELGCCDYDLESWCKCVASILSGTYQLVDEERMAFDEWFHTAGWRRLNDRKGIGPASACFGGIDPTWSSCGRVGFVCLVGFSCKLTCRFTSTKSCRSIIYTFSTFKQHFKTHLFLTTFTLPHSESLKCAPVLFYIDVIQTVT